MKKFVSMFLVLAIVFSLMAGMGILSNAGTNGHSQADALAWLNSKIGIQIGNGQCPALAKEYYAYLGYSVSGNGKDYENNVPSGWSRTYYSSGFIPQPGDVAVWRATNTALGKIYGHVAIVKSGSSSNMICYEQGNSAGNKVRTNTYSYGSVTCFIRPDFNAAADITTPTLSFNKGSYLVGETATISWTASPSGSNFKHYWLVITNTTTGKQYYGTSTGADGNPGANSYSLKLTEAGTVKVDVYAVRPDGSGKSDSKTFNVRTNTPANIGDDFYAYIIKKDSWIHLENRNNNVQLTTEGNKCIPMQIWHFTRFSNGSYKIISTYDDKSIDADNRGTANETNIKTFNSYDTDAQRWYIYPVNGGYTISSVYCNKVFDVAGGRNDAGTNVQFYDYNESGAQIFSIYRYDGNNGIYEKPSKPDKAVIESTTKNGKEVTFNWSESPLKNNLDSREYYIRIHKDREDNEPIHVKFGIKSTSYTYTFDEYGTYYITVASVNSIYYNYFTWSDVYKYELKENDFDFTLVGHVSSHNAYTTRKITKEATCTEKGEQTLTCSLCSYTKTEEIAPLGHNYNSVITKANGDKSGYITYTCTRCGDTYTEILPDDMHLTVPELKNRTATVTVKSDNVEYSAKALNGEFIFNGLSDDVYRVYVKAKNSTTAFAGEFNFTGGKHIEHTFDELYLPTGDVNGDNIIDIADLSVMMSSKNYASVNEHYDITGDGYVDLSDIAAVLLTKNYGKSGVNIT